MNQHFNIEITIRVDHRLLALLTALISDPAKVEAATAALKIQTEKLAEAVAANQPPA